MKFFHRFLLLFLLFGLGCQGNRDPGTGKLSSEIFRTQSGASRANPLPLSIGEPISQPGWELTILDMAMGEDAWRIIKENQAAAERPLPGEDFLLLQFEAINKGGEDLDLGVSVTGDRLVEYHSFDARISGVPSPYFGADMEPGESDAGWLGFRIHQDEPNLILVLDELFSEAAVVYVALTEGAAIAPSSTLTAIEPTAVGADTREPAAFVDLITTEDWQLHLIEAVYGESAQAILRERYERNAEKMQPDMDYILIKVWLRYIGEFEDGRIAWDQWFETRDSEWNAYTDPYLLVPEPELDQTLYPGGETEGWIVVQIPASEQEPILVFDPTFDPQHDNKRFISLQGYGR